MTTSARAQSIHQDLLDRSGTAMMLGDFDGFRKVFALPMEVETFDYRMVMKTEADLRQMFDRLLRNRADAHVTDLVRRCVTANYQDAETIWATHETRYIFRGNTVQARPHAGFSVLKPNEAGDWQVVLSQYAVDGRNALNDALRLFAASGS